MFRRRPISIRWSLLRSFLLVILSGSLSVLILMALRARRTEVQLSRELIMRGTSQARRELDRVLQPAREALAMAARWGAAGLVDLGEVAGGAPGGISEARREVARRIDALFLPHLLAHADVLSSVQVSNERGQAFFLLRAGPDAYRNRIVDREAWGLETLWYEVDREGRLDAGTWREVDYDPRRRGWYTDLEERPLGQASWTAPYVFFTTNDLGITASMAWEESGVRTVASSDVLLGALTRFTQGERARVSENALAFIATGDWRMLGLPRYEGLEDETAVRARYLEPAVDLGIPVLSAAVRRAEGRHEARSVFRIDEAGEAWWAGVEAYPLEGGQRLWISTLVPNRDLLADIEAQRVALLVATLVALAAAILYALLLARSYSRPLEALAAQSRRIRDLDFGSDARIEANLAEFQELAAAQEQSLKALQSFGRYVPLSVVRQLVATGEVARIGGELRELTVLFTDIQGFTRIAEGLGPQPLTDHMARYFEALVSELEAQGATIDKIVGDGIVAFWGAPRPLADHAAAAARGVLAASARLDRENAVWRASKLPALHTRFALASGTVVVGNIGAPSRLAYTVLGDAVNYASRLEGINKVYGTTRLVDARVHAACADEFSWRRIDRTVVLGRTRGSFVYELLGARDRVSPEEQEAAALYEQAWDLHAARRFDEARRMLRDLLYRRPSDAAARRLLVLCEDYARRPPAADWDATTHMTTK